jgi:hypothetical protein
MCPEIVDFAASGGLRGADFWRRPVERYVFPGPDRIAPVRGVTYDLTCNPVKNR